MFGAGDLRETSELVARFRAKPGSTFANALWFSDARL
jgi:hypothetical protein